MTKFITPESEQHWLAMRDGCITSTAISALFGLSPYLTRFELFHHHASGIRIPFVSNDRVEKGSRMEQYAAEEVGRKEGWSVAPFKDFALDENRRVGSSFDYVAETPEGKAILEIKAVDFFRYLDLWVDDQAPEHIEIQLQWQMHISGIHLGYIAAWTSVYEYNLYRREYDPEMGAAMDAVVAEFWDDVAAMNEPEPDFSRDEDAIAALFRSLRPAPLDLTSDEDFDILVARHERAKATEKEAKKEADATKAEIHYRLADAPEAFGPRYYIKAKWTKDTPDRVAEPGEVIKGRKGYRQCILKNLKEQGKSK